jgi:hypothetical protein
MRQFFAFLLVGAIALAIVVVGSAMMDGGFGGGYRYDPVAEAREAARIAAIERDAALNAVLGPAFQIVLFLGFTAIVCVGVYIVAAWGVAAVARFRHERRPDAAGRLPVPVHDLQVVAPAALAAYHGTQHAAASRQLVPASLNYAPHYNHRSDAGGTVGALVDEPAGELAAPVPSVAQLLTQGRIGRGNPMLLGYDAATGQPIHGDWRDLYSTAIGGLSGSGKSWTATFLAAQAALFGSRIVLLDPHADNAESLASRLAPLRSRFLCDVAVSPKEMRAAVALVAEEHQRRVTRKQPGESWLFIADEFSALQRGELAEPLAALAEALGQEGRKLGMYGMFAGQVWSASRSGGTELRDSLASAYMHRLRPAQARMLSGITAAELPPDLLSLPAGCAYFLDTSGELRKVIIPEMRPADVGQIAGLLGDGSGYQAGYHQATGDADQATDRRVIRPPAEAWRKPDGSLTEAYDDQATTASGSGGSPTAEAQRAAALFLAGSDLASIVYELRGVKSSEGRRYQAALADVQALIRSALGGRQVGG